MNISHVMLSSVTQLDRQPVLRRSSSQVHASPRYLQRLPTLLLCAMTVQGARRCLESIAFVLVAWARTSSDAMLAITLMEACAQSVRKLSHQGSFGNAGTVAQITAEYIDEMIEMARLWQVFYRVYRPVSAVQEEQPSKQTARRTSAAGSSEAVTATNSDNSVVRATTSAMDFLPSAAEAVQGTDAVHADRRRTAGQQGIQTNLGSSSDASSSVGSGHVSAHLVPSASEESLMWSMPSLETPQTASTASVTPTSGHASLADASMFEACIPFDLEAFLKDVDQLF